MREILFVELLGGIGDVLIVLPAIQALGRCHPDARLTVLTFAPGGELLEADPLIHRVVYADRGDAEHPHRTRHAVEAFLARQRFDLIVSNTNYDGIDRLIRSSGARRVVTNLWRNPPPDERVGERFLKILLSEGLIAPGEMAPPQLHLPQAERRRAQAALGDARRPLVFLFPDAGMAIKRWPPANFVALGRALSHRYGATVLVPVGSDREQAAQVIGEIDGARVWPRGSLRDLAAALAQADLAVAADTGAAHIAAALGVPTITLFGPSWHGRYGQAPPHVNLQGYPECPERVIPDFTVQRCWYSGVCPLERWSTCLEAIAPADVLAAAAALLGERLMAGRRPAASRDPTHLEPRSPELLEERL